MAKRAERVHMLLSCVQAERALLIPSAARLCSIMPTEYQITASQGRLLNSRN
jgi:hypothetical protein